MVGPVGVNEPADLTGRPGGRVSRHSQQVERWLAQLAPTPRPVQLMLARWCAEPDRVAFALAATRGKDDLWTLFTGDRDR